MVKLPNYEKAQSLVHSACIGLLMINFFFSMPGMGCRFNITNIGNTLLMDIKTPFWGGWCLVSWKEPGILTVEMNLVEFGR